jgi:hypothetical protein
VSILIAVAVGLAAGGIAYASIPGPDGVIHGCYAKINGQLRVIDSSLGGACTSSEKPLNGNQIGPTGPRGPSDAYLASDGGKAISVQGTTLVSLSLPAGNYTLIAKTGVYTFTDADIIDCLLQSGNTMLDEDEVRTDPLAQTNDDNEFMDLIGTVSLPSGGTVSVVCRSGDSFSENTQLLATQVATLH